MDKTEVEQKFWCQVYIASIRAGESTLTAKINANNALSHLRSKVS